MQFMRTNKPCRNWGDHPFAVDLSLLPYLGSFVQKLRGWLQLWRTACLQGSFGS